MGGGCSCPSNILSGIQAWILLYSPCREEGQEGSSQDASMSSWKGVLANFCRSSQRMLFPGLVTLRGAGVQLGPPPRPPHRSHLILLPLSLPHPSGWHQVVVRVDRGIRLLPRVWYTCLLTSRALFSGSDSLHESWASPSLALGPGSPLFHVTQWAVEGFSETTCMTGEASNSCEGSLLEEKVA